MITVDLSNPPSWAVLVGHEPGTTWPFPTGEAAGAFYHTMVDSGRYEHIIKPATKRRPAVSVSLVSLWRRETVQTVNGTETTIYVLVEQQPAEVQP